MPILTDAEQDILCFAAGVPTATVQALKFLIAPAIQRQIEDLTGLSLDIRSVTDYLPAVRPGPFRPSEGLDSPFERVGGTIIQSAGRGRDEDSTLALTTVPVRYDSTYTIDVRQNVSAYSDGDPSGYWPDVNIVPAGSWHLLQEVTGRSNCGLLRRFAGSWATGVRTVRVIYSAGYTQAEINSLFPHYKMAFATAMSFWAGQFMRSQTAAANGGQLNKSVSIKDFSVSFETAAANGQLHANGTAGALPADALAIIQGGGRFNMRKWLPS